jgi:hypothetical protein
MSRGQACGLLCLFPTSRLRTRSADLLCLSLLAGLRGPYQHVSASTYLPTRRSQASHMEGIFCRVFKSLLLRRLVWSCGPFEICVLYRTIIRGARAGRITSVAASLHVRLTDSRVLCGSASQSQSDLHGDDLYTSVVNASSPVEGRPLLPPLMPACCPAGSGSSSDSESGGEVGSKQIVGYGDDQGEISQRKRKYPGLKARTEQASQSTCHLFHRGFLSLFPKQEYIHISRNTPRFTS